jgi:hypothetical protein
MLLTYDPCAKYSSTIGCVGGRSLTDQVCPRLNIYDSEAFIKLVKYPRMLADLIHNNTYIIQRNQTGHEKSQHITYHSSFFWRIAAVEITLPVLREVIPSSVTAELRAILCITMRCAWRPNKSDNDDQQSKTTGTNLRRAYWLRLQNGSGRWCRWWYCSIWCWPSRSGSSTFSSAATSNLEFGFKAGFSDL